MMRSTYNNNNNNTNSNDEDDFAPNPFRTTSNPTGGGGNMDFFEITTQQQQQQVHQQQQQPQYMNNINYAQPDPNTGMVGSIDPSILYQQQQQQQYMPQQQQQYMQHPQPQQQQQHHDPYAPVVGGPTNPSTYLTGTMDNKGTAATSTSPSPAAAAASNNNGIFGIFYSMVLSCIQIDRLKLLFDIDTIDIYIRMKSVLTQFYIPNYFRLHILGIRTTTTTTTNATTNSNNGNYGTSMDNNTANSMKGPDLYGPIWISFTCMFLLGCTANMNDYYQHVKAMKRQQQSHHNGSSNSTYHPDSYNTNDIQQEEEFEYDIEHLLHAMYICFMYTFGISTFFWLICICFGLNVGGHNTYLSWTYWVCIYGYSLLPILCSTIMAGIFSNTLYHWIVLSTAVATSGIFILRNISTPLLFVSNELEQYDDIHLNNNIDPTSTTNNGVGVQQQNQHAKAAPVLLSIMGAHFTFLLILKLTFYP